MYLIKLHASILVSRMGQGGANANMNGHVSVELYDPKHGVKMGVPNGNCDDAKVQARAVG